MSALTLKVLHVEDDVSQRLIIAKYLAAMKEYTFTITRAAAESTALAEFARGGFDLVLLDYRLTLGDGLTCLRKLRQADPAVPIVALSGVAPPDIVEQMLTCGANDYINKDHLNANTLAASVRRVLVHAPFRAFLVQVARAFATTIPAELYRDLDELEAIARQVQLTPEQLQQMVSAVLTELGDGPASRLLRPVLGDLLLGLFPDRWTSSGARPAQS
jgi:CheY-like chemotaxis protein